MDPRLKSYLRPLRRRWGFTQREIAFLVGVKSGTVISRVEGLKRKPSLSAVLALAAIFSAGPLELFPGAYDEIRRELRERATILYEELQGNPSKTTRVKLDFLEALLARLEENSSTEV